MRVLVCDPAYPLDDVREALPDAETGTVSDAGPGVAAWPRHSTAAVDR